MLTFLWYLLVTVEVLLALLLILLVLLQRSREDGLGLAFGSAMGESLFGTQASTILTKATVVLIVLFLLNTIALGRVGSARWNQRSSIVHNIPETSAPPEDIQPMPSPPLPESDTGEISDTPLTAGSSTVTGSEEAPLSVPLSILPAVPASPEEPVETPHAAEAPPAPAPAP